MTTPFHRTRTHAPLTLTPTLRHLLDTLSPTDRFHIVRYLNDATPLPLRSSASLRNFFTIYTLLKKESQEPQTTTAHLPLLISTHPKMQTRSQTTNNHTSNQTPSTTPPNAPPQLPTIQDNPPQTDTNPPLAPRSSRHSRQTAIRTTTTALPPSSTTPPTHPTPFNNPYNPTPRITPLLLTYTIHVLP